jgi:hypothetical protein
MHSTPAILQTPLVNHTRCESWSSYARLPVRAEPHGYDHGSHRGTIANPPLTPEQEEHVAIKGPVGAADRLLPAWRTDWRQLPEAPALSSGTERPRRASPHAASNKAGLGRRERRAGAGQRRACRAFGTPPKQLSRRDISPNDSLASRPGRVQPKRQTHGLRGRRF